MARPAGADSGFVKDRGFLKAAVDARKPETAEQRGPTRTTARTPRRTLRTRCVRRDDSVRTSPELIWMTAARDATKRILSGRSPRKALARYATTLTRDAWQHASRDRTIYETANAEHSLFSICLCTRRHGATTITIRKRPMSNWTIRTSVFVACAGALHLLSAALARAQSSPPRIRSVRL